jgi:hypothetical protein
MKLLLTNDRHHLVTDEIAPLMRRGAPLDLAAEILGPHCDCGWCGSVAAD